MRISDWSSDVCSSDLDLKREIDKCGEIRPGRVEERHLIKADPALRGLRQFYRMGGRLDFRDRLEQLGKAACRARASQKIAVNLRERAKSACNQAARQHKGSDGPARQPACSHIARALPQDKNDRPEDQADDDRRHYRPEI